VAITALHLLGASYKAWQKPHPLPIYHYINLKHKHHLKKEYHICLDAEQHPIFLLQKAVGLYRIAFPSSFIIPTLAFSPFAPNLFSLSSML
jgi:hypothetical protein